MQREISPGYKQTEVGVFPEDWRIATLGELCNFENGDRGVNYPSGSDFVLSGIPFVNAGHLQRGRIALDKLDFITHSKFEILGNGKFQPGDVLFCLRGSLGKFALVGDDTPEGAVASSLIIIRPRPKSLALEFLVAYLDSKICGDMIELWAGGAAQPNLGGRELARFLVPIPPTVEEQHSIAAALADADALIAALEGTIAKKRDLKQAAMQHLLTGKTRLPGFSGEWEVKRLGDVAPLQRGFDLPTTQLESGPYPVVYSNGILNSHSTFQVKGPGIVTGRSGTIGKVNYVEEDFWPHNTALWVTSFKGNDPKFIFSLYTRLDFERFATGSGVPTLNRNDVHAHRVSVPTDPAEQTAIAEVLSDMDADLAALEAQAGKARAVKQGMMQELLTGRVRLV